MATLTPLLHTGECVASGLVSHETSGIHMIPSHELLLLLR